MTSRGSDRLRRAGEALDIERIDAPGGEGRTWDVLVNATPAGSLRDPRGVAVDPGWAAKGGIVVETNYRPIETPLVHRARQLGLKTVTGDAVYAAQAAAQLRMFVPGSFDAPGALRAIQDATAWALDPNASS
jgi:shikimate dehydrogenase